MLRFVAVGNTLEGVMLLEEWPNGARIFSQLGLPLLYVEYLATAPKNRVPGLHRFSGVGTALLVEAILESSRAGFSGRIGLHSLPQADEFYRCCGFTGLGGDPAVQNLHYFEMRPESATSFVHG